MKHPNFPDYTLDPINQTISRDSYTDKLGNRRKARRIQQDSFGNVRLLNANGQQVKFNMSKLLGLYYDYNIAS